MFEKCCLCNRRSGLVSPGKSGYIHPSSQKLLKLEDRWYIDRNDLWLCPHCMGNEKQRDLYVLRKREEQEERQAEQRRKQYLLEKRVKFYEHPEPDDEIYRSIWTWMKLNIGKKAWVSFCEYRDGSNVFPAINKQWEIEIPDLEKDTVTWSWTGGQIRRFSSERDERIVDAFVRLSFNTRGAYSGCHTVECTSNMIVYRIGYSKEERVYSDGEIDYINRIESDLSKVTGWTTYEIKLLE